MRTQVTAAISDRFRDGPMSAVQMTTIALCTFMNALDGFDVLAMAFTAPMVSEEWGLPPTALGVIFSASIIGMALGSAFIAPFADRMGRKPLIMACLAVTGLGMVGASFSLGVSDMAFYRLITGLGIGGLLPNFNALVAEYASNRRRDLSISVMTMGYSVGAVIGGLLAVYLMSVHGWRSVFAVGALSSLVTLVMVALYLPESVDLIAVNRSPGALDRINRILKKIGHPPLHELPSRDAPASVDAFSRVRVLLGPTFVRSTVATFVCFFLVMSSYFVLVSWTPKFLVDMGLTTTAGISGSMLMNLTGIVGGMLLGALAGRFGLQRIGWVYLVACFIAVACLSFGPSEQWALILFAAIVGFFMNGAVVTLYALAARVFPPESRATGTGLALGFGRLGGALGPFIYGLLVSEGVSAPVSLMIVTVPMVLGVFALSAALSPSQGSDLPKSTRVQANG